MELQSPFPLFHTLSACSEQALLDTTPGKPASIRSTGGLLSPAVKSASSASSSTLSWSHLVTCKSTDSGSSSLWNHFFTGGQGPPPLVLFPLLASFPPCLAGSADLNLSVLESPQSSVLVFASFPVSKQVYFLNAISC